jgi:hypothetical protein
VHRCHLPPAADSRWDSASLPAARSSRSSRRSKLKCRASGRLFARATAICREADSITFIIENGVAIGLEVETNGNKRLLKKVK